MKHNLINIKYTLNLLNCFKYLKQLLNRQQIQVDQIIIIKMIDGNDVREQGQFHISPSIVQQAASDTEMKKAIIQFEYKLLQLYAHKLGIVALPNELNIYEWNSMISVPAGLYSTGKFKFNITFPMHFPFQKPKIKFIQPVYHPMVNSLGEVDVDKLVADWKYGQDCMLYNLLSRFADIFLDTAFLERSDSFNPEAAEKYRGNMREFISKVNEQIQYSKDRLFEKEKDFSLSFTKPNQQIVGLLTKVEEINDKKTLSFQEKKRLLLQHVFQIKSDV